MWIYFDFPAIVHNMSSHNHFVLFTSGCDQWVEQAVRVMAKGVKVSIRRTERDKAEKDEMIGNHFLWANAVLIWKTFTRSRLQIHVLIFVVHDCHCLFDVLKIEFKDRIAWPYEVNMFWRQSASGPIMVSNIEAIASQILQLLKNGFGWIFEQVHWYGGKDISVSVKKHK